MGSNTYYKTSFTPDFYISHQIIVHKDDETDYGHYHDSFEIYFTLTDGVQYLVNDKSYPLKKGDLFVFNHMDMHRTIIDYNKPRELYIIHFMPGYIRELSSPQTNLLACFLERDPGFSHRVHLQEEQSAEFVALFEKAIRFTENKIYGQDIYKKILLAEILLRVNYLYLNCATSHHKNGYETGFKKVGPILDYINNHLDEDLSLVQLAKMFYLSRDYLGNLFKSVTGYTVGDYIISRRITMAKQYLLDNLPISKVIEKVGFNNYSHFIRTFKHRVGVTPKQYAKKN